MKVLLRRYAFPAALFLGAGLSVALILGNRAPLAAQEDPAALAAQASPYDWLQYNGDPQHTGNNTQETVLGASNVASLQFLFQATLPSVADGAPVYLRNVTTPTGTRDLLFVTTKAGHIIAPGRRDRHPGLVAPVRTGDLQDQQRVVGLLHDVASGDRPESPLRLQLRAGRLRPQVPSGGRNRDQRRRMA